MALEEPPVVSEQKVQALFYYLDSVKSQFVRLAVHLLNGVTAFSELNPALTSMLIYVFFMGMGVMLWIVMGFLDLAVGTHVLDALLHVMEGLNVHVLPAVQLLNGLLALLFGLSTLLGMLNININMNVNSNRSRSNPNKMSALPLRSKMIGALPKVKYGSLRRKSDDLKRNDSSSCAICLGCIGEEDGVRILPNCRHFFHIACIDHWLLLSATNSSCPLCRATVVSNDFQNLQAQEINTLPAGGIFSAGLGDFDQP